MPRPPSKSGGCALRTIGTSPDATTGIALILGMIALYRRNAIRNAD
jgi:hypothetical protein